MTDAHGQAMINADRDFPQYYQALAKVNAEQLLGIGTTDGATTAHHRPEQRPDRHR